MTDPAPPPEHAAHREQEPEPDSEMLRFAAKIFNLARAGDTGTLAAYVDAGVPVNLCNDKGAVFKGERAVFGVLLDGGADPAAGMPSAVETARMFGLDDLIGLFEGR